jgi:cell division protein FtsZ
MFDVPAPKKAIIKVIGVGGGGSNAVIFMHNQGIKDVDFVVVNTDAQALDNCEIKKKIQIGRTLTEGLGAGANPEKGREAAKESENDIAEMLADGTKMVFITAGMGGGTGTGAAPVIAEIARELNILTVGIVTYPFSWEGPKKRAQADLGIEEMRKYCDTVLVILNDKLREMFGNLRMRQAFAEADNILATGARSIAEIITVPGMVNVDFEDVKAIMQNAGTAVMGSASVKGDNRAVRAAEEALASPLLNTRDITGADRILIAISSSLEHETTIDELEDICKHIQSAAGNAANIIYGHSLDETLGEYQRVTVIATSFDKRNENNAANHPFGESKTFELDRSLASQPIQLTPTPQVIHNGPVSNDIRWVETKEVQAPTFYGPEPAQKAPAHYGALPFVPSPQHQAQPVANLMPAEPMPAPQMQPMMPSQSPEHSYVVPTPRPERIEVRPQTPAFNPQADLARKRAEMLQRSEQRRNHFGKTGGMQPTNISQMEAAPAYARRGYQFDDQVAPVETQNVSRFALSEDQELTQNNKFLHDNVD